MVDDLALFPPTFPRLKAIFPGVGKIIFILAVVVVRVALQFLAIAKSAISIIPCFIECRLIRHSDNSSHINMIPKPQKDGVARRILCAVREVFVFDELPGQAMTLYPEVRPL